MEKRKIEVRRLAPELCEDWVKFFDDIAFKDHKDWAFCYCLEGHLDRKTQEEWTNPTERREKAMELIQDGEMQGYLAYFCFLVAPEYRGRGVEQNLLDKVCEDALKEGYTYIETYPFVDGGFEFQYHGTQKMYERNNFTEVADFEFVKVMRKSLVEVCV